MGSVMSVRDGKQGNFEVDRREPFLWPFGVVLIKGCSTSLSLGFSFSGFGFDVVGAFADFAASFASFSRRFASFLAGRESWIGRTERKVHTCAFRVGIANIVGVIGHGCEGSIER